MRFRHSTAAWGFALLAAPLQAWSAWAVTPFAGPAGASWVQLWDVNDAGQIVGESSLGSFIYQAGNYTWLASGVGATGISNDGLTLVGGTYDPATQESHGWISRNGVAQTLDAPGASTSAGGTLIRHVSANGRYAVGTSDSPSLPAFVLDLSTLSFRPLVLPGNLTVSVIQGVNDAGWVTGSVRESASGAQEGLLYNLNTLQTQVYPSVSGFSGSVRFRDINETGLMAGSIGTEGFVGSFAQGFDHINIPGATVSFVYGVNNAGLLVGYYGDAAGNTNSFTAVQVPEPETALLLLGGLTVLGFKARRVRAA